MATEILFLAPRKKLHVVSEEILCWPSEIDSNEFCTCLVRFPTAKEGGPTKRIKFNQFCSTNHSLYSEIEIPRTLTDFNTYSAYFCDL